MSIGNSLGSATTVVDLAAHMARLRTEAERLQAVFQTRERGFFTPSEDDQVLHLWMSYHKSRCALLDLIQSIRDSSGRARPDNADQFMIALAAGLVLIDAARSLRDLFGKNELVRRKLNESYELYGIASGSFDDVQMSLTDPGNALQLNKAVAFFDEQEGLIREIAAQEEGLKGVLSVIDALIDRGRVGKRRYVKVRAIDRGRELKSLARDSVSNAVYAIQELGSRLVSHIKTIPNHVPGLPEPIEQQLLGLLLPGDVIVTRKESALTNYFLPGYWPHAAFYVGDQQVIEALKDGVRRRTMESPMGNDAVAVIRPRVSAETVEQAIARAQTHIGKPYDFDFDFTRADRMVCTEVVYRSFEGLEGLRFPLSKRAGRETLSAEDLLCLAIDNTHFDQVAVFCPKHSDQLVVQPEMASVLEQTVARSS